MKNNFPSIQVQIQVQMHKPERLLGDYGGANAQTDRLTIVNQPVNVANFQLHLSTINQLERKHVTGKVNEYENKHLQRFLTMSNTLKIDGHTEEAKKLRMFPFTLAEEVEEWFYSLPAGSITSWEEMEKPFLNEYFLASTKQLIDTAVGGSTNFSTTTGIKKIIEASAANEHKELYDGYQSKPEGVIDLKPETNKICIEDTIAAEVDKKLKAMNIGTQQVVQVQPVPTVYCEICSGPHQTVYCFETPQQVEEIKFLKQNNPYSNTYNPGWENHPNFSWKDQKGTAPQYASSSQAQGALPSATVINPREHNNVSAVTTRNGKSDEVVEEVDEEEDQLIEVDLDIKENEVVREKVVAPKPVVKETVVEPKPVVKLPFPTRNKKKGQHEKNFETFFELFKKLEINIPLLEAHEQMPTYAKFMKDIISRRRTTDTSPIILTETYNAILQGMKIPIKKKD
ncbi:uncharacterized protein LOC127122932 [Lathyrus oleraceus]|uniref:uncharacterized protein LOC127122932 n=1 Tax=Pisum sativum TaxID=3888 RepID=UPI0021D0858A|nr:uncharacterized protein LOC127122932 [Pisum sativum]